MFPVLRLRIQRDGSWAPVRYPHQPDSHHLQLSSHHIQEAGVRWVFHLRAHSDSCAFDYYCVGEYWRNNFSSQESGIVCGFRSSARGCLDLRWCVELRSRLCNFRLERNQGEHIEICNLLGCWFFFYIYKPEKCFLVLPETRHYRQRWLSYNRLRIRSGCRVHRWWRGRWK